MSLWRACCCCPCCLVARASFLRSLLLLLRGLATPCSNNKTQHLLTFGRGGATFAARNTGNPRLKLVGCPVQTMIEASCKGAAPPIKSIVLLLYHEELLTTAVLLIVVLCIYCRRACCAGSSERVSISEPVEPLSVSIVTVEHLINFCVFDTNTLYCVAIRKIVFVGKSMAGGCHLFPESPLYCRHLAPHIVAIVGLTPPPLIPKYYGGSYLPLQCVSSADTLQQQQQQQQ